MEENRSILYITNNADLGGISNYLLEIIKLLPTNYTPYFIMSKAGYFSEELKKIGISEKQIFFVPMTNNIFNFSIHLKSYINISKIVHKIKPYKIHCNAMTGGIAGRIAGFIYKIPVIYTVHGWTFSSGLSILKTIFYKLLEILLSPLTQKFICVCDFDTQIGYKLLPWAKNKISTIKNGISDIPEEYRKKEFSKNELKIVMISRFAHPKDPYTLIFAVHELIKEGYSIKLDLYGYGPELNKVLNCIKNQNDSNIQYKGEISNVIPILKDYDVYALISKKEGLPIGVLEAMRCGLPLLLSSVGGMTELIEGNGLYVKSQNIMDCRKQIKLLWDKRERLAIMGQKSRKIFEEEYTAGKMVEKTLEEYKG